MTTYLVTRHEGTRYWARGMAKHGRLPFPIDRMVDHLDPSTLKKGDVVVGTVPFHLAADLRERGIEFWALDIDLPPEDRGKELSGVYLATRGARLTRYEVKRKDTMDVAAKRRAAAAAGSAPAISVIAVSDELAPAAIGWRHHPTPEVCLLASADMKKKAEVLKRWLSAQPDASKVVVLPWDDRDYPTLVDQAESLADELTLKPRRDLVVHLTGGTKPMAMALQRAFGKRSGLFTGRLSGIYVDTGHKRIEEMLAPTLGASPMRSVLGIADLLALRGLAVVRATSAAKGHAKWLARRGLFDLFRSEAAQGWRSAWYALLEPAQWLVNPRKNKGGKNGRLTTYKGSYCTATLKGWHQKPEFHITVNAPEKLKWPALRAALEGDLGKQLHTAGAATLRLTGDQELVIKLDRQDGLDELDFLAGLWMEAWIAAEIAKAGADDWAQGVTMRQGRVENEVDLLVAAGNRLLLIEVKTGRLDAHGKDDSKATEALYKLDAVSERISRLFRDRWLVSLQPIGKEGHERAAAQRIRVFDGPACEGIGDAIREWVAAVALERDCGLQPSRLPAP
jgi:CRISPR-associated protein Csx16